MSLHCFASLEPSWGKKAARRTRSWARSTARTLRSEVGFMKPGRTRPEDRRSGTFEEAR